MSLNKNTPSTVNSRNFILKISCSDIISLMRLRIQFYFLTFVLSLAACLWSFHPAWAAGTDSLKPKDYKAAAEQKAFKEETSEYDPVLLGPEYKTVSVKNQATTFFSEALLLRAGLSSGSQTKEKKYISSSYASLQRYKQVNNNESTELGFDIYSFGYTGLNYAKRWRFLQTLELQPYWKAGLASYYNSSDLLVSLIDYRSYVIRIGTGFENLFNSRKKWQCDLNLNYGERGLSFQLGLGYSIPSPSFF